MERSLDWDGDAVVTVDQRALPQQWRTLRLTTVEEIIDAIGTLAVRGAPAIGVAGAFGVALSARRHAAPGMTDEAEAAIRADAARIAAARPTAVNLAWAVELAAAQIPSGPEAVLAEALRLAAADEATNRAAAANAAELIRELTTRRPLRMLTHCNTGRLATVAWGTALGAIRELAAAGEIESVLAGETRPLLQGARLTVWELAEAGIPHRLCVDSAGPAAIGAGLVDCVVVGADRITPAGDVANKIGTYSLAVAAAHAGIPFVVVAPESTIDPALTDASQIPIEERSPAEVTAFGGRQVAPEGTPVYNPAFDVTPAGLVTAVVTEDRVIRPQAATAHTPARPLTEGGAPTAEGSALAGLGRELYARGWMEGTAGNLSVRLDGERALITASGRSKGSLGPADVVEVRVPDSAAVSPGSARPSAETAIHTALYRAFPECGAVVHAHPPYCTVASTVTDGAELVFRDLELIKGLAVADPSEARIPVFANWPDVARIGAEVEEYFTGSAPGVPPVLLISGHGATAWGPTLEIARNRLECLEGLCRLRHLITAEKTR
jgi:S-methyl-5-thioribose-1-phosphate isomerase/methylthioribulose-1-phosphate dehydratase